MYNATHVTDISSSRYKYFILLYCSHRFRFVLRNNTAWWTFEVTSITLAASRSKQCFANQPKLTPFLSGKFIWDCDFTLWRCVVSQFLVRFRNWTKQIFFWKDQKSFMSDSRFISFWFLMSQIRIWWNELVSVSSGFSGRNGMVPQLTDDVDRMNELTNRSINQPLWGTHRFCDLLIVSTIWRACLRVAATADGVINVRRILFSIDWSIIWSSVSNRTSADKIWENSNT